MLKSSILTMWQKLRGTLTKANAVKAPCSDTVAKANRQCSGTLAKAERYIVKGTWVLYSDPVAVLARQVLCCMFDEFMYFTPGGQQPGVVLCV